MENSEIERVIKDFLESVEALRSDINKLRHQLALTNLPKDN